jgi:O-acetyl-ADP-ribose deacetylase
MWTTLNNSGYVKRCRKMTTATVVAGDVTKVRADALITAINSGGMWFGGIDGAIQRCANNMFHAQAAAARLQDGATVFAQATSRHSGAFRDVLFVVDDLRRPLSQIVRLALDEAERQRLTSVTLPAIRTGVMAGVVERTAQEAVTQLGIGVRGFIDTNPRHVKTITFVVYNDPASVAGLRTSLALT